MPKNTKKAEVPSRKRRKKLPLQQKIRTIMETDEFFTTGAFALRTLPKIIATFRGNTPQRRLQKAENTSCKLYTE